MQNRGLFSKLDSKNFFSNIEPGDSICFDLDEIATFSDADKKELAKQLEQLITKKSNVIVYGLTDQAQSNSDLSVFLKLITIIPNAKTTPNLSKEKLFDNHIQTLSVKPKRTVMMLNLEEHLIRKFLDKENIGDIAKNFIVALLKQIRDESDNKIRGTESLSAIDEDKKLWFGNLTDEQIKLQVLQIIAKEPEIEYLAWEFVPQLTLPEKLRTEFLQRLSDRIDNLVLRFCPDVPRYAKLDKRIEEGQAAAGVLTYAKKDNEIFVLLGKRDDNGFWECFGGRSDENDIYFHNTGAREAYEESSQQFLHSPIVLMNSPFHDIVTEKDGKPFVFRLYLREHEFVDQDKFLDHEHTEYQWVKLSDFHQSLAQTSFQLPNGNETINVQHDSKELTLSPEFYQVMKQHPIKDNISRLNKGNSLLSSHTQGTPDRPSQKKPRRHFHSPNEISWQVKKSVLNHLNVMSELKEKYKRTVEPEDISTQTQPLTNLESQSVLHMRATLGEEFNENDLASNVEKMIEMTITKCDISITPAQKDKLKKHCLHFVELEKQGGANRMYYYHAVDNKIKFVYNVYSAIHQLLQANPEWQAFRGTHDYFKPFANIESFILHYSNFGKSLINDADANYNETTISTNFALFGNYHSAPSSSISYFLKNETARSVNLKKLLKNIVTSANLPEILVAPLLKIYKQHYKDEDSSLYQISIPMDAVDELSYASRATGILHDYEQTHQLTQVQKKLKEDLDSGDPEKILKAKEYLMYMQSRLMTPPHQALAVNAIEFSDINDNKIKCKPLDLSIVKNLVQEMVFNAPDDTLHSSIPYQRLYRMHTQKIDISLANKISRVEITSAINADKIQQLEIYLKDNPDLVSYAVGVCLAEGKTDTFKILLDLFPHIRKSKIQLPGSLFNGQNIKPLPLFEAITSHGKDRPKLMSICYGEQWMDALPSECRHTADSVVVAVTSLSEDTRHAYANKYVDILSTSESSLRDIIKLLPQQAREPFVLSLPNNVDSQRKINNIFNSLFQISEHEDGNRTILLDETIYSFLWKFLEKKPQYFPEVKCLSRCLSILTPNQILKITNKLQEYAKADVNIGQFVMWLSIRQGDLTLFNEIISHYPELKEKNIDFPSPFNRPIPLFWALTEFFGDLNNKLIEPQQFNVIKLLSTCFGPKWMYDSPEKYGHSINSLLFTVWSLPEDQRYSHAIQHLPIIMSSLSTQKSVLTLLTLDEQASVLSELILNEKSEKYLRALFDFLDENIGKNVAELILDRNDFSALPRQLACDWLEKNDPALVLKYEAYVNKFIHKYQQLVPRNTSANLLQLESDFLNRLAKTQGFVAKFYLIQRESKILQSPVVVQVASQLELEPNPIATNNESNVKKPK